MSKDYRKRNKFNRALRAIEQATIGKGNTGLFVNPKKDIIFGHFQAKKQNKRILRNLTHLFISSDNIRTSDRAVDNGVDYRRDSNRRDIKAQKEQKRNKQNRKLKGDLNAVINYINETKSQLPYCKHEKQGKRQIQALLTLSNRDRTNLLNGIINASYRQILSHTTSIKTIIRNIRRVRGKKPSKPIYFYYVVINPEDSHLTKNELKKPTLRTSSNQNPYNSIKESYKDYNNKIKNKNRTDKKNYIKVIREQQETAQSTKDPMLIHNHDNLIIMTTKGNQKSQIKRSITKSYSNEMQVPLTVNINKIGKQQAPLLTTEEPTHKQSKQNKAKRHQNNKFETESALILPNRIIYNILTEAKRKPAQKQSKQIKSESVKKKYTNIFRRLPVIHHQNTVNVQNYAEIRQNKKASKTTHFHNKYSYKYTTSGIPP